MDDLDFVSKLENDKKFFIDCYNDLGEFYNLRHYDDVLSFISKHKGLIVLLNHLKSHLIKTFPTAKFDLIYYVDPEVNSLSHIMVYVKVDDYTFDNGVMDKIDKIDFDFIPLSRKLDLMGKLTLMPMLYYE